MKCTIDLNSNKDELIDIIREEFENESLINFFMKQLTLSKMYKNNRRYNTEAIFLHFPFIISHQHVIENCRDF